MSRVEHLSENCTVHLGDCRDILPSIHDADLLLTDPPYKVTSGGFGDLEGGFSGWIKDSYDNKGSIVECDLDWSDWLPAAVKSMRESAHAYIFSNDRNLPIAWRAAVEAGLSFHRLLTWDKKTALPNRWYIQNCEFVLFMRTGRAFQIKDCGTMALQSIFQRDESAHPTEKPVPLAEIYIKNSTERGMTVLDPFMGSCSFGVAAINVGRNFVGIEKDQKWFDVSRARIERALRRPGLPFEERPKAVQVKMDFNAA